MLIDYCKGKKQIVCYGAGEYGRIVRCFLYENGIDISFYGVTDYNSQKRVLGIEVLKILDIPYITNENTGVLICANNRIAKEMEKYAKSSGINNYYVIGEEEIKEIDNRTEYKSHFKDNSKRILLYHRVGETDFDMWNMFTKPEIFKKHLLYLKTEYNVVKYEEIDFDSDEEQVAITIDDGYVDSYTEALPIIEECEVPVTIFVSTNNVGKKDEFWWDVIERAILFNDNCPKEMVWNAETYLLKDFSQRVEACWKIRDVIMRVNPVQRKKLLEDLETITNSTDSKRICNRTVDEKELIELDKSPWITIGSHAVTHTRLTSMSIDEVKREFSESKRILEGVLGHHISTMSYPFGCKGDYDLDVIKQAKETEYERVAAVSSCYKEKDTIAYNSPRISVDTNKIGIDYDRMLRRLLSIGECV